MKERIENNAIVIFGSVLVAGFVAGYGVHSTITASPLFGVAQAIDWQATAKAKGWIPGDTCPAIPVHLDVSSPGSNAVVEYEHGYLYTETIVRISRPLPEADSVGIIFAETNGGNYYVSFPIFDINNSRTVFRESTMTHFRITGDTQKRIDIWGFVIDDKSQIGSHYGSLDEIRTLSPNLFMSDKVTITAMPGK